MIPAAFPRPTAPLCGGVGPLRGHLEEYAREMIYAEELHASEVDKMLRKAGDITAFQQSLQEFKPLLHSSQARRRARSTRR